MSGSRLLRGGFSLIELLVVVGLLVTLMGMAFAMNSGEKKDAIVGGAAQELAATLRKARSLALERKGIYAVSFNIANPAGSPGLVLSNRSGGHWYRILGPDEFNASMANNGSPTVPLMQRNIEGWAGPGADRDKAVPPMLEAVSRSWIDDRHVLPPGKVRFLALTDQDNGSYMDDGDTFPATYPRPWFGWYDSTSNRLFPWGGYDANLLQVTQTRMNYAEVQPRSFGGKTISHSAFFFEGDDGAIIGSVNPSDRWIVTDNSPSKDGWYWHDNPTDASVQDQPGGSTPASAANGWLLFKAGEPRPVINGDWQDFTLRFYPDGTVRQGPFLELRAEFGARLYATTMFTVQSGKLKMLGPGDMCNQTGANNRWNHEEATSYEDRTGTWWITLAPDTTDSDRFANAGDALRSLMPAYRVGINRLGDVRVVKISNSPGAAVFEDKLTGNKWNNKPDTDQWLSRKLLVDKTGAKAVPLGMPVETFITPEMMTNRSWWLKSP